MSGQHADPDVALALHIHEHTLHADPQIASIAHFLKSTHGPVERAWNAEILRLESTGLADHTAYLMAAQTIVVAFGSLAGGALGSKLKAEILEDAQFLTRLIEMNVGLFREAFVQALEHAIQENAA